MMRFEPVVMLLAKDLPLVNFNKLDAGGGWISPVFHVKDLASRISTTKIG